MSSSGPVAPASATADAVSPRPWLFNAPLDLLVGCGAWSLPLLGLTFVWQRDPARATTLGLAFYALGIFCNNPHYMATLHRAYHTAGDFAKYRFFTVYVTVMLVLALVLVHLAPALTPWVITLYLTWSPWHYTGQNFGIAQLLIRRSGAVPDPTARNLLQASYVAAFLVWASALHVARPSADPNFLSLALPDRLANTLQLGGTLAFLGCSGAAFARLLSRLPLRSLTGPLLLTATQALWFVVPALATRFGGLELPASYFSAGALAFMHCAQYLWITTYYARRDREAAASTSSRESENDRPVFSFCRYYALLVVGGIALFVPGPWIASRAFGHDFVESFLIFMALVNLHHFILDGAVWKLRDGRLARLLLGRRPPGESTAEATLGAANAGETLRARLAWFFGPAHAARASRWGFAALLVALAALDQWQYAATSRTTADAALERAAAINPADPRPHFRRARRLVDEGRLAEARGLLDKLVAQNPRNAPAQHLLGEILMRTGQLDAALAHYRSMAERFPADLATETNLGLLHSARAEHLEAVQHFATALRLAPGRLELIALHGEALISAGQTEAGAAELERFCARYETDAADLRLLDRYLEIAQRLGTYAFERGDFSAAERRLQNTANVAATHHRFATAAESLALLARVQRQLGRPADAAANETLAEKAAGFAAQR